jgi:hypothetical protein
VIINIILFNILAPYMNPNYYIKFFCIKRTSLELCKLLLSLDPEEDPLAAVLMIDFYAIQAKEYEWFIEFCNLWENSRNLQQLPNIAYSLSLAYFHLGKQENADEILQNALIMFPGVLIPLLEICHIHTDSKVIL